MDLYQLPATSTVGTSSGEQLRERHRVELPIATRCDGSLAIEEGATCSAEHILSVDEHGYPRRVIDGHEVNA